MEQRLGAQLVDRSGNATIATMQGQMYYERLSVLLGQLEELDQEDSGENLNPSGLLHVTCSIDFGQEFVTDWLLDFRKMYPNVDFDLVMASGFVDMNRSWVDVALRVGNLPDCSLIARKLADVPRVLVASPDYLARRGMTHHSDDLSKHDFVFFSAANRQQSIELFGPDGTAFKVQRTGGIAVSAVRSAVRTFTEGHGLHVGPL